LVFFIFISVQAYIEPQYAAVELAVGLPGLKPPPTAGCTMELLLETLLHFCKERKKKQGRKGNEEQERRKRAPPTC
jgi:hypothetical protein